MVKRKLIVLFAVFVLFAVSGCVKSAVTPPADESFQVSGEVGSVGSSGAGQAGVSIAVDANTGVVADIVADIFAEPDVKSERVTQTLYNQPVSILAENDSWSKVKTADGSVGWVRLKSIVRDVSSISCPDANRRVIVTSRTKSVYSEPKGGVTLKDVVMGSEFYSFAKSGDAYEIYLPGNARGWLKGSGIITLGLDERIPLTKRADFVSTALKFKGASYLEKGLSALGIDSPGLVYISAMLNGLDIPRNLDGQLLQGTEVQAGDAAEGDLVFLSPTGDRGDVAEVGICTGNGRYIYTGKLTGYVAFGKLGEKNADGEPAVFRRIFPD